MSGSCPSGSSTRVTSDDDDDFVWTRVDVGGALQESDSDTDDNRSMVVVSRDAVKNNVVHELRRRSTASGAQPSNDLGVIVEAKSLELLASPTGISHAATEIGKYMPEAFDGEHQIRIKALVSEDPLQAKMEAFRFFAYQLSNNLIDDEEDVEEDGRWTEGADKFTRAIDMFKGINLPRESWVELFSSDEDRTTTAFAEALFAAAINNCELEIIEALLNAGVDPNQPLWTPMTCRLERPIQVCADCRVRHLRMASLLIRAGADVNLVTDEDKQPALHEVARSGTLEMAKLLVEGGSDTRYAYASEFFEPVSLLTPLVCATDSRRHAENEQFSSSDEAEDDEPREELESLKVFRYLLSLCDDDRDSNIVQDALVMAAYCGRPDMIELLVAAGADVNGMNNSGFTPLVTAAWRAYKTVPAATALLKLGAKPNPPLSRYLGARTDATALHIAAANGDTDLVNLLIDHGADVDRNAKLSSDEDVAILGSQFRDARVKPQLKKAMVWYRTPLQLALYRNQDAEKFSSAKTKGAAMSLLVAGARLMGRELVEAVSFNSEKLVRTLLDRGAAVNARDWRGWTPLQASLNKGHVKLARILLRAGAELNGSELFFAFATGDRKLVEMLVANGADVRKTGPHKESLLEAAAWGKHWELMLWAMEELPIEPYDSGVLCAAVCSGKFGMDVSHLEVLLKRSKRGRMDRTFEATAIGCAAYHKNWPVLRVLLRRRPPFHPCILPFEGNYYGYKDIAMNQHWGFRSYSETRFWHDKSMLRCSVLVPAVMGGSWAVVQALLRAGHRPDPLSLLTAVKGRSRAEFVELMSYIPGGAFSSAARHDLDTPLQLAVRFKRVDIAEELLRQGANVNALPSVLVPTHDKWGGEPNELSPRSALQSAVESGHLGMIDMLLDAGADVNGAWSQDAGATALQLAAGRGHLGIARRLLELGADVNARRAELRGRTALEGAAEQGRLDMVQFLLENRARTMGNKSGGGLWQYHRAIRLAKRNGHSTVAKLLEGWREWTWYDRQCRGVWDLLDDNFEDPGYIWSEQDDYYSSEESFDDAG